MKWGINILDGRCSKNKNKKGGCTCIQLFNNYGVLEIQKFIPVNNSA
jgi:hypothetical protein